MTQLLAELEQERSELDSTIALLRRRLGMSATSEGNGGSVPFGVSPIVGRDSPVTGRVRSDEFFRLSIADAISKYLGIMKQPQNPMAIVNGLKAGGVLTNAKNFYANVNTELKRMRERNLIVNTPSGWGLAEWYPRGAKGNEPATPKKKKSKKTAKKAAGAKAKAKAGHSTKTPAKGSGGPGKSEWTLFAAEQMKAGKSMKAASVEWKKRKAAKAKE
ncbi:MAG TPA: hypothetical protein VES88_15735 [Gemmatimonadaceae bacterium]|nr:hypothetical protein [Gemmatimonadaceae bacterium]